MYKPLPKYLTIKQSPIEGLGLFATEDIDKKQSLGISHIWLKQIDGNKIFRTPLGGFLNHSEDNNCYLDPTEKGYYCKTSRDIKAGEELTTNYNNSPIGSEYVKEFE